MTEMNKLVREEDGLWVLSNGNRVMCRFFIGQTVRIEMSADEEDYCPIGEVKSVEWTSIGLGINVKDSYVKNPIFIKIQDIEKMELW